MPHPRFSLARAHKFVRYTTANVAVTSTTFVAFHASTELTLDAQPGDVVEASVNFLWSNEAPVGNADVGTVVSGSVLNRFGTTFGLLAWRGAASAFTGVGAPACYTLTSGDIVGGRATLRLLVKVENAGTKNIAGDSTAPVFFAVKNLGPVDPN